LCACFSRGYSGSQTRGATANDSNVYFFGAHDFL
jgi:hypothetical protein